MGGDLVTPVWFEACMWEVGVRLEEARVRLGRIEDRLAVSEGSPRHFFFYAQCLKCGNVFTKIDAEVHQVAARQTSQIGGA